jgi:8-oxo-dGTP diphosphatase
MKEYVLGFAFDNKEENIVVIEKLRPEWQKGLYNGIGGKIETSDSSNYTAMCREFREETGVITLPSMWYQFSTLIFEDDILGGIAKVYCFKMFTDDIFRCKTTEDENIRIVSIKEIVNIKSVSHLKILIDLALDKSVKNANLIMR